ncbi:hypothetical protein SGPA1_21246 [Streptomyces misionensis JCM 4497]
MTTSSDHAAQPCRDEPSPCRSGVPWDGLGRPGTRARGPRSAPPAGVREVRRTCRAGEGRAVRRTGTKRSSRARSAYTRRHARAPAARPARGLPGGRRDRARPHPHHLPRHAHPAPRTDARADRRLAGPGRRGAAAADRRLRTAAAGGGRPPARRGGVARDTDGAAAPAGRIRHPDPRSPGPACPAHPAHRRRPAGRRPDPGGRGPRDAARPRRLAARGAAGAGHALPPHGRRLPGVLRPRRRGAGGRRGGRGLSGPGAAGRANGPPGAVPSRNIRRQAIRGGTVPRCAHPPLPSAAAPARARS